MEEEEEQKEEEEEEEEEEEVVDTRVKDRDVGSRASSNPYWHITASLDEYQICIG
jgi:hypothetical protein